MRKTLLFTAITVLLFAFHCAQAADSDSTKTRRNIIRWNLTPLFIVGPKSIVLGYERVLKNNQSISINIGYLERAPFTNEDGDVIKFFDQSSRGGIDIALDYRFYFKKRNKFPAPDGLYWGPYTSYYALWQDASIKLLQDSKVKNTAYYNAKFQMYSLGLQLGYQFVINDRFTIDLILMGPSFSYYDLNLGLRFEADIDSDDPFYQDLMDKIQSASPFLAQFIRDRNFDTSGRVKFGYYGFRYGMQVGYHF